MCALRSGARTGSFSALIPWPRQLGIDPAPELAVVVSDDDRGPWLPRLLDLPHRARHGLVRPAPGGVEGRLGRDRPPTLDVEEGHHGGRAHPSGGEHIGGEEVAGPQRLGVAAQEGVPQRVSMVWRGLDLVPLEDVADCPLRDRLDAQFPQLTQDLRVVKARLARMRHNQPSDGRRPSVAPSHRSRLGTDDSPCRRVGRDDQTALSEQASRRRSGLHPFCSTRDMGPYHRIWGGYHSTRMETGSAQKANLDRQDGIERSETLGTRRESRLQNLGKFPFHTKLLKNA